MVLTKEARARIEDAYGPIVAWDAATALGFIQDQVESGLTPVMQGTSFYRHSFGSSQFGSYLYYLDARGTKGACQPRNVIKAFDFIPAGLPVAGSLPDLDRTTPETVGKVGVFTAVIPGRAAPTLLEAATAALRAMDAAGFRGSERDDLELAIMAEGRIH